MTFGDPNAPWENSNTAIKGLLMRLLVDPAAAAR
jgi:hypothetical protein